MKKKISILKQDKLINLSYYSFLNNLFLKNKKGDFSWDFNIFNKVKIYNKKEESKGNIKIFFLKGTQINLLLKSLSFFLKGTAIGFFFELSIRGIGFKCFYFGENKIFLNLGYSHYIVYNLPYDVISFLKKGKIYLYSLSKMSLGLVVKDLKNMRIPDAYKAKGVVDSLKVFSLKEGKKR